MPTPGPPQPKAAHYPYRCPLHRAIAQIGRDCVGALQILPPGVDPTGIIDIDAELLTEADVARIIRLPQEDMCQATATPPHLKYEADGGPGIDQIMRLLDGSIQRDTDRLMFFRTQVLFWMLCAPDGHAKNFSLALRPNGAYQLTPLYDVMSAYPVLGEGPNKISPHRAKLAMAIHSKSPHWRVKDIQRRHWLTLGRRYGILAQDGRDVGGVLDDLVTQTPEVIKHVHSELPLDFPMDLAEGILEGLRDASERLGG